MKDPPSKEEMWAFSIHLLLLIFRLWAGLVTLRSAEDGENSVRFRDKRPFSMRLSQKKPEVKVKKARLILEEGVHRVFRSPLQDGSDDPSPHLLSYSKEATAPTLRSN